MSSLNVLFQFFPIFELPSALLHSALECDLGHVIYQGIDQFAKTLDLLEFLIISNVLLQQVIVIDAYHDRVELFSKRGEDFIQLAQMFVRPNKEGIPLRIFHR